MYMHIAQTLMLSSFVPINFTLTILFIHDVIYHEEVKLHVHS